MRSKEAGDQGAVIGLVAVFSMLVSMVIFEIIVESVGCIFMFYSIDKQFIERGLLRSSKVAPNTFEEINRYSTNPYGHDESYNKM